MLLSKRQLTKTLHGTLLPEQAGQGSSYAATRKVIRQEVFAHLGTLRKKGATRKAIAEAITGTNEYSIGERVAYAAYCIFMETQSITPKTYSCWRIGNKVINASTDLRRSTKSRWLEIRDKNITIGSVVMRSTDPKTLLKVTRIGSDCMVAVSHPHQTGTFSITPACLVRTTTKPGTK